MHAHAHAHTHIHNAHACTHIYTHTHIYAHVHIHTHIHTDHLSCRQTHTLGLRTPSSLTGEPLLVSLAPPCPPFTCQFLLILRGSSELGLLGRRSGQPPPPRLSHAPSRQPSSVPCSAVIPEHRGHPDHPAWGHIPAPLLTLPANP